MFEKTRSIKYKPSYKQEGYCNKKGAWINMLTSCEPGKHILKVTFKVDGETKIYTKHFQDKISLQYLTFFNTMLRKMYNLGI